MNEPPHDPRMERTIPPFPNRLQRAQTKIGAFHLREVWWRMLDFFEKSRGARIALYFTAFAIVAGFATWFWAYPAWSRRNSVRIARQWLAAGQLRYAADAAKHAAEVDPTNPAPWQIAAELARLGSQFQQAREYSRRAAELAPTDPDLQIGWAADALRDGKVDEADLALDRVSVEVIAASPHAQRLRGEIARRQGRLTSAKGYFEAAIHLEGPLAVNEVPLGIILLNATDPKQRQHGLELLAKWTNDREWGANALRLLLEDALTRNDRAGLVRWAEALRAHPGCTVGDMPRCLLALSVADKTRYEAMLASLEKDHAVTPQAAAQLLSWLNRIGRGADAVTWMKTLPEAGMKRPPLVVEGAEALRQANDWTGLREWTAQGQWGADTEFLRWSYGLLAARKLGETVPADNFESTLYSHAQLNGAHGLFAAGALYSWGLTAEAEAIWLRVSEQEGELAIGALGSLARHYQVRRDAEGQYRVFRRLHSLRPHDADIANNFAFFAALTDREERIAENLAKANFDSDPSSTTYLATYAFTLLQQGRFRDALRALQPKASLAEKSPAIGFVYGLALAKDQRRTEAKRILDAIPPETLTLREAEMIKEALRN